MVDFRYLINLFISDVSFIGYDMFLCVHFNKVSKFIKPYSRKLIFTNYYRRQVVRNIFQGQPSCNNTSSTVRVRFAPSPTGKKLHLLLYQADDAMKSILDNF